MKSSILFYIFAFLLFGGCNTTPDVEPPNPNLRVWPNPARYTITIYVNNTGPVGDLKVIDKESRTIFNGQVPTGENQFEVDLQSAPEGMCYALAKLSTGNLSYQFIKVE